MRKTITIMIIALIISTSISFAKENVKTHKFNKQVEISGVIGSSANYFDIENNIDVTEARLNLILTKSELLDPTYSTITVYVNDTPIGSKRLSGKKIYKNEVSFDIPTDLLKTGYNELKVKAYKTISDKICSDDNNSANWLVLHEESNINIKYNYKNTQNLISSYKDIFMNIDNSQKLNTTIVVPTNSSSTELSSAMIISSDIGKKIKYSNYKFELVKYDEFDNKNDNLIYIGKETNSPKELLALLTEDEKKSLDSNCLIKIVDSIYSDNKKILLIISNKDELLLKGSKLVTSNELINNLNQDTLSINSNSDISDIIENSNDKKVILKDLGYENINLKGPFTQEAIIDINTPKNKVVSLGSKVKLNLRYADNLDFDRSLVTVNVNDIPIGSKKLEKSKSNNDSVEFDLPKELLNKNYYQIKIVFNLEMKDLACVTRDMDTPWAYIGNDSSLELVYKDNSTIEMANYPYPFVNDYSFNDIGIVIPNNLTSKELTDIANIISFMGHDIKYNNGDIKVIKESEFNNKHKDTNLIIIGTPNNNKVIKDINENLNLKYKNNFDGFESNEKIKMLDDISTQVASIQLMKSPFKKDKDAMVITSTNASDLNLATRYLTDLGLTKSLTGDTVVIYRNGYIDDYSQNVSKDIEKENNIEENKISSEGKVFVVVAGILFISVVASIIILIRRNKKYLS